MQYINRLWESPTSIIPCSDTLSGKVVSTWTIKEGVLYVTRVGGFISFTKPYEEKTGNRF